MPFPTKQIKMVLKLIISLSIHVKTYDLLGLVLPTRIIGNLLFIKSLQKIKKEQQGKLFSFMLARNRSRGSCYVMWGHMPWVQDTFIDVFFIEQDRWLTRWVPGIRDGTGPRTQRVRGWEAIAIIRESGAQSCEMSNLLHGEKSLHS